MVRYTRSNDQDFLLALIATGVWLGIGGALDAYLVAANKKRLITDVLRTKPGLVFLIVLCLHVVNVLGPVDPFRTAAKVIQSRKNVSSPSLSDIHSVSK